MGLRAKAFVSAALAVSMIFSGCDKHDDTLDQLEKADISYIMKTNLTCVNGEELYVKTPFYVPSDILIRYERPVYFDGRRLYFFRYSITEAETNVGKAETGAAVAPRTAVISYYDTEKNEVSLVLEEENKKHISYSFAAFKDSYLYYYRLEQANAAGSPDAQATLCRISIEEKKPEEIAPVHISNGMIPPNMAVCTEKSVFFEYPRKPSAEENGSMSVFYSYSTESGKYEEFKTDAENLMKYKDGIAYIKENKVYYLNLTDNSETEIYAFADDEILSLYSNGEKIFYQYFVYDEEEPIGEIGYISDGKKVKIGEDINLNTTGRFTDIEGEKMLLLTLLNGEELVYDERYDCIVRISLNREERQGFPAEDSIMFVCYDYGEQNPIFYLYSREKVKVQLPSAENGIKDNLLEHP